MESTTYSQFRQNLKKYMNQVNESHAPAYVIRSNQEDVVMLSKADYEGIQETLYWLSSSENAKKLYRGIKEYEEGQAVDRELIEEWQLHSCRLAGKTIYIGKKLPQKYSRRSMNSSNNVRGLHLKV